jgi:hypothetical protein
MFDIPALFQLPVGLAIGIASIAAPGLVRPFVIVATVVLGVQGALLYSAGGPEALSTGLALLAAMMRNLTLVLVGIAIGRWGTEIVVKHR